jgi:sulfopyruvate decarboxylase TPP-binding subunit
MGALVALHELPAALGLDIAVGVPDSQLSGLMTAVASSMPVHVTPREDVAVGVACGLALGGRNPLVYLKNAGLFTCGDALLSLARDIGVTLFLVVGWAGTGEDKLSHHVVTGERTVPFLRALGISYRIVSHDAKVDLGSMRPWYNRCGAAGRSRALLVRPGNA